MGAPSVAGLEVFLAIVEEGSLRGAAAALGVQPPAVSYRLNSFDVALVLSCAILFDI